jgi:hypothetical protein
VSENLLQTLSCIHSEGDSFKRSPLSPGTVFWFPYQRYVTSPTTTRLLPSLGPILDLIVETELNSRAVVALTVKAAEFCVVTLHFPKEQNILGCDAV